MAGSDDTVCTQSKDCLIAVWRSTHMTYPECMSAALSAVEEAAGQTDDPDLVFRAERIKSAILTAMKASDDSGKSS